MVWAAQTPLDWARDTRRVDCAQILVELRVQAAGVLLPELSSLVAAYAEGIATV